MESNNTNFSFNEGEVLQATDGTNSNVPLEAIVGISALFLIIDAVGITGNFLVIFVIVTDRKMRQSVTNLFIMNLALSDLFILLFGVPEIVLFMLDRGWLLGEALCKLQRYVLVVCLYSSVITLVAVCVERSVVVIVIFLKPFKK